MSARAMKTRRAKNELRRSVVSPTILYRKRHWPPTCACDLCQRRRKRFPYATETGT